MATGYDKWLSKPLPVTGKWTENGLYQFTRRWEIDSQAMRAANIETECFLPRETADEEYTDAFLVDQGTAGGSEFGVKLVYFRVYSQLPADDATLVQLGEDVVTTSENGLKLVEQRFVARAGHTLTGTVGTTTGDAGDINGLYLSGNGFTERGKISAIVVKRWAEAGILSISPIQNDGSFSLVQQYSFTSLGITPEALHAISVLPKPAGGSIAADAIFFEPDVTNVNGFRRYTQIVTNAALDTDNDKLVHTKEDFFTVTDPGVMGAGFQTVLGQKSGAASVFPQAASLPKTYRKKGTINVYLTTNATIAEVEAAYQDQNVEWAQQATYNLYFNDETGAASGNGGWRPFPGYLDDGLGDAWAFASQLGSGENWEASAYSYKSGDTSYTKTGIYRVMPLREYFKAADGTQYYLRTVISFD